MPSRSYQEVVPRVLAISVVGWSQTSRRWDIVMWDMIDQPERGAEYFEAREPASGPATARILIIDDDPHFLRVLQRILANEAFSVTATSNSCEGLKLLRSDTFNLAICDLRMPDCDGLNVLQSVRGAGSQIPVIILTAYGEVDSYLDAMNCGATEYLNKPIRSDLLVQVVRDCLGKTNCRLNSKRPDTA